jgi:hypothetical protein
MLAMVPIAYLTNIALLWSIASAGKWELSSCGDWVPTKSRFAFDHMLVNVNRSMTKANPLWLRENCLFKCIWRRHLQIDWWELWRVQFCGFGDNFHESGKYFWNHSVVHAKPSSCVFVVTWIWSGESRSCDFAENVHEWDWGTLGTAGRAVDATLAARSCDWTQVGWFMKSKIVDKDFFNPSDSSFGYC